MSYNKKKNAEYFSKWYYRNKKTQIERIRKRKIKLQQWFQEYKKTLSCEICGERHCACLDFHHKDPDKKDSLLSEAATNRGWGKKRIMEEIKKCKVLCANCHRKLHYKIKQETFPGVVER